MMNNKVIKCNIAAIAVLAACFAQQSNSAVSRAFENACHNGADARIEFHIVNDVGRPVSLARVNVFFDMMDRSKGRRIIGDTDTNGVFVAEARTGGILEIEVSREGHYRSTDLISFINMGHEHEVKSGKWQPWGMVRQITLLPVKKPVAQIAGIPDWKWTKAINKWVGFDLMKYDFVEPYGGGSDSDMEIMFEWDGAWRQKYYNGMSLSLRFPQKFSGGYYADKTPGSEYGGIYHANTNGNYKADFTFSDKVATRDKRGNVTSWDRHFFDASKVLVVRSRCKFNVDGTLKAVNYFQLSDIQYACDEHGAALKFLSIYNPTPNDTNLEPK
jgi:hypothetical protein